MFLLALIVQFIMYQKGNCQIHKRSKRIDGRTKKTRSIKLRLHEQQQIGSSLRRLFAL